MHRIWFVLLVLAVPEAAVSQIGIPPGLLGRLEDATVFILAEQATETKYGSGCLFKKLGKSGYIVTNAHVVCVERTPSTKVSVVFHSGTEREKKVRGVVVGVDHANDLAVVEVEMEDLPAAIVRPSKTAKVSVTMPVWVLGFPFGQALSPNQRNPEVTISQATVSSVRKDDAGRTLSIQLDGDLNPGNSGGPIVNAKGNLIAIARAAVEGRSISFGVPGEYLDQLLAGRVQDATLTELAAPDGSLRLQVEVTLADPMRAITQVGLVLSPPEPKPGTPEVSKSGEYRPIKGTSHKLRVKDRSATGTITLKGLEGKSTKYLVQVKYVAANKRWVYLPPKEVALSPPSDRPRKSAKSKKTEPVAEEEPSAPIPPAVETSTKTPAPIEDLAVAGGSRYIVMKLQGLPSIAVYDLHQAEIVHLIRVPDSEFLLAAGGDTAVVYLVKDRVFQAWSLRDFTKKKTKPSPVTTPIVQLLMGRSNGNELLVTYSESPNHSVGNRFLLYTDTLEPLMADGKLYTWQVPQSQNRQRQSRSDATLQQVADFGYSELVLSVRSGDRFTVAARRPNASGPAIPGEDGYVYSNRGQVYTTGLAVAFTLPDNWFVPALSGGLFLGVDNKGAVTVFCSGKSTPICRWGEFPGWPAQPDYSNPPQPVAFGWDQRVIFAPNLGRIVFIPLENDRLEMRPFNLKATLDAADIDYLVVTSAPRTAITPRAQWKYQIEAVSKAGGITYKLELAPDGMTISPDGLLSWKVPARCNPNGEKVVVLIADQAKEKLYHTFTLLPSPATAGAASVSGDKVHRLVY